MLIAILLANLPVRYWSAFDERFPVHRMAWLSGAVTMLAGIGIGMSAFLPYAGDVASQTNQAYINAHGDLGLLPGAGMTVLPMFLLTTPLGLLSLYLTGSGFLRAVGAFLADDPRGDFILTGLDGLVRGRIARTRAARAKSGWESGAYLVASDGAAHRIGEAFDLDTPAGLRTAYPVTPLTTLEPIRHAIAYKLPRKRNN